MSGQRFALAQRGVDLLLEGALGHCADHLVDGLASLEEQKSGNEEKSAYGVAEWRER